MQISNHFKLSFTMEKQIQCRLQIGLKKVKFNTSVGSNKVKIGLKQVENKLKQVKNMQVKYKLNRS